MTDGDGMRWFRFGLVMAMVLLAAACGSTSGSDAPAAAATVTEWASTNQTKVDQLEDARQNIIAVTDAADSDDDIPLIRTSCVTLGDAVEDARKASPIPDADIQKHWAATLAHYSTAASGCVDAIDAKDGAALAALATESTQGTAELALVQKALAEAG